MTNAVDLPGKGLTCGACKLTVREGDAACPHCKTRFRKPAEASEEDPPHAARAGENEVSNHPEVDAASIDKTKIAAVLGEITGYGLIKLGRAGNPVLRIRLLKAARKKGIDSKWLMRLFAR